MATIYFAGAITGDRGDLAIYRSFVSRLRDNGHIVFAPCIDPTVEDERATSPSEIFQADVNLIQAAASARGLVVADVSVPSTGVGYEVALAVGVHLMRTICLFRPAYTPRCSAMISGNPAVTLIQYVDEADVGRATRTLQSLIERG
jgi:hypothetical protein